MLLQTTFAKLGDLERAGELGCVILLVNLLVVVFLVLLHLTVALFLSS
jgi:hypothetical protein